MAMTHVELYEALKGSGIGEKAARMIADVVPPAKELATKLDISGVREEIAGVRAELAAVGGALATEIAGVRGALGTEIAGVRGEIHAASVRNLRWMIAMFVPVWAGSWGTVVAVLLKG